MGYKKMSSLRVLENLEKSKEIREEKLITELKKLQKYRQN